ncbi:hypothetical protein DFJ73DRAFT_961359 [Zopfochytrium polystomum]|nr:hypothetical protein DFJ73DRAFT_961359 [Zopfochytrium polystomum]
MCGWSLYRPPPPRKKPGITGAVRSRWARTVAFSGWTGNYRWTFAWNKKNFPLAPCVGKKKIRVHPGRGARGGSARWQGSRETGNGTSPQKKKINRTSVSVDTDNREGLWRGSRDWGGHASSSRAEGYRLASRTRRRSELPAHGAGLLVVEGQKRTRAIERVGFVGAIGSARGMPAGGARDFERSLWWGWLRNEYYGEVGRGGERSVRNPRKAGKGAVLLLLERGEKGRANQGSEDGAGQTVREGQRRKGKLERASGARKGEVREGSVREHRASTRNACDPPNASPRPPLSRPPPSPTSLRSCPDPAVDPAPPRELPSNPFLFRPTFLTPEARATAAYLQIAQSTGGRRGSLRFRPKRKTREQKAKDNSKSTEPLKGYRDKPFVRMVSVKHLRDKRATAIPGQIRPFLRRGRSRGKINPAPKEWASQIPGLPVVLGSTLSGGSAFYLFPAHHSRRLLKDQSPTTTGVCPRCARLTSGFGVVRSWSGFDAWAVRRTFWPLRKIRLIDYSPSSSALVPRAQKTRMGSRGTIAPPKGIGGWIGRTIVGWHQREAQISDLRMSKSEDSGGGIAGDAQALNAVGHNCLKEQRERERTVTVKGIKRLD